jgi:hypothetical protein
MRGKNLTEDFPMTIRFNRSLLSSLMSLLAAALAVVLAFLPAVLAPVG